MKYVDYLIWDTKASQQTPHIIKNGSTTVAFGYGVYNEQVEEKLRKTVQFLEEAYINTPKLVKGVAKLCPGDVYDEKYGIKLASKKAEYKARKQAYKRYDAILKGLNSLGVLVTEEMNKIQKRIQALEEDFSEGSAK